jgi:hypothetical protein
LPVEGFPIMRHWYVVHRTNKRLSAASQAFRDLLLAADPAASGVLAEPKTRATGRRVSNAGVTSSLPR